MTLRFESLKMIAPIVYPFVISLVFFGMVKKGYLQVLFLQDSETTLHSLNPSTCDKVH